MSEIKQVTVALSHPDELNPRRRRRTRKLNDESLSQSGGEAPVGIVDVTGSNTGEQIVKVQKDIPIPVSNVPQTETPQSDLVPQAVMAATPFVGGGAAATPGDSGTAAVKIREKKTAPQTHPISTGVVIAPKNAPNAPAPPPPKIIPHKKRISSAPVAQTLKKPKFVIPSSTPPLKINEKKPANDVNVQGVGDTGVSLKKKEGDVAPEPKDPHAKRRFTERRIKIEVKPTVKTRKSRKLLKERIDGMHIQSVRRLLIKKGIIKPKSVMPPEEMMRSMLHDYYLLKQNE